MLKCVRVKVHGWGTGIFIVFKFIISQADYYGVDWDGPVPNNQTDAQEAVEVPTTSNPLQEADYVSLTSLIDPLRDSDEYGVDIYLETLSFIHSKISIYW